MDKSNYVKALTLPTLTRIAIFSALAFVLTFLKVNLPVFPEFLDLELSEVPEILALLTCGLMPALFVLIIKNLLMLTITTSLGIGVLANFIMGFSFLITMGLVLKRISGQKGYWIGALLGTVAMTIAACIFNYYILIPAYTTVLNYPLEAIIDLAHKVNSNVTDLPMLIVYAIAPFNVLKAILFSLSSYLIYKLLKPALKLT